MTDVMTDVMTVAACLGYGAPDVVELRRVPMPTPKPAEILVRVLATTVASGDARVRALRFPSGMRTAGRLAMGWGKPRQPVLGTELAGEVVKIGSQVTRFKVNDAVIAVTGVRFGAHAQYVSLREDSLVVDKPQTLSYPQAASIAFGGQTALWFLRDKGRIQPGQRILINGASGAVGSAAVQLAKFFGARVTGACSHANRAMVESLGADEVIDYRIVDVTRPARKYDLVLDTAGQIPFSKWKNALVDGGCCLLVDAGLSSFASMIWTGIFRGKRAIASVVPERIDNVRELLRIHALGGFTPIVGRVFPIDQIVDAHRYVDSRHKQGSAVVEMNSRAGDE